MTPIRDLIDIPERVHRDDFVLRLSEGVTKPAETLRTYVVTPQLADAFDRALDLIKGALASGSSKAAYLHGSFGSGKSHFMAVLHLLLQQHAEARAAEGLEGVVTRHGDWLAGRRFLLAPYHMIGKPSLEAAVLGGYAARVAELHPDAPTPGVYRSAGLFDDARRLRAQIGDETFFARVNETAASTAGTAAGWGDLSARWDAASFEAALGAPAGAEERSRLVAALVDSFFRGYRDVARGSDEAFVPLDEGLAVIARHARDLGYDALVLFLDELILWLATHAADLRFLNEEGPKVSKLVEAETAGRAVPIVSFVARQRELAGEQVTGALQLGFADVLQWWEARFERITLEDRNLPEIAEALAAELHRSGTRTFVSHSSLALDERRRSEEAFAQSRDCVIVATSTLELGIDVGDLDRVIQIDAPGTVASFLQRLGRTGRRPSTQRNCLFLATSDDGFLRASGLLRLWLDGYVESVVPPPEPFHIFAQQLLALALQEGRIGRQTWREWLGAMPAFLAMTPDHLHDIIEFMLARGILFEDGGMLSIGAEGERSFGHRHFMELMSVFTSDPLFSVRHGRTELGLVHPLSFQVRRDGPVVLLLAGRSWEVSHVDWDHRIAYVKASAERGRSRWVGPGVPLSFDLCRAIRRVLVEGSLDIDVSKRARTKLDELRQNFSWVDTTGTAVVRDQTAGTNHWWTFAGLRANTALGQLTGPLRLPVSREDNLSIRLRDDVGVEDLRRRAGGQPTDTIGDVLPVTADTAESLKFSSCLPEELALRTIRQRGSDAQGVRVCLEEPIRSIVSV